MNKRFGIIGVGSAGILGLCHFLSYLNEEWEVVSLHDPSIPIVGIGESTNPGFLDAIEYGLDFKHFVKSNMEELDATLKIGTEYENWREKDFTNPFMTGSLAIHFNTYKLKNFALERLPKIWGDKFKIIECKVNNIFNRDNKAVVETDNGEEEFEYVMDCRGFPKDYSGYNVIEDAPLNHCLVHNCPPESFITTKHVATKDGWMFVVPLQSRKSCGYMFNNKITSVEEAKKNFSELLGIDQDKMDKIEFKFNSYYTNRILDGRIIKNGNNAVFFEPMFGNSLYMYDAVNKMITSHMLSIANTDKNSIGMVQPFLEARLNEQFRYRATAVDDMLAFHYQGGSNFDTDFWKYAVSYGKKKTSQSKHLQRVLEPVKECVEKNYWANPNVEWIFQSRSLILISKNLGYDYFKKRP